MKRILIVLTALALLCSCALAESLTFTGSVTTAYTREIYAPIGGTVESVNVMAGQAVQAGDTLVTLATEKVYAAESGTVTGVFGQPGDSAETISERYGAILYIEGESVYTISASTENAYNVTANKFVHVGESVYLSCCSDGSHTGTGVITSIEGTDYAVEVRSGAFLVGETVSVYRGGSAVTANRIGRGALNRKSPTAVTAQGSIAVLHVSDGDHVERGDLLLETLSGSFDGIYMSGSEIAAAEDGNIARILDTEGAAVAGAVLELSPISRHTIHRTVNGAYRTAATTRVHAGEPLYIRRTTNGTHRVAGFITRIDGDEYRVETMGSELYIGKTVYLYRDASFTSSQRVGIGTVVNTDTQPYESQGTLVRLHVSKGESVERGELLYEIAEGRETELTTPIDGIVTEAASSGAMLRQGQIAFAIAPPDEILVEIQVGETTAGQLAPGDSAELIYADDPEEDIVRGTIQFVSPVSENGLYTARIAPKTSPERLGLTVYVRIGEP